MPCAETVGEGGKGVGAAGEGSYQGELQCCDTQDARVSQASFLVTHESCAASMVHTISQYVRFMHVLSVVVQHLGVCTYPREDREYCTMCRQRGQAL